jgi:hypothetical protein
MPVSRYIRVGGYGALFAALAIAVSKPLPQAVAHQGDALAQLTADVHALKVEVLRLRFEAEETRMSEIERELSLSAEARRQLTEEEHVLNQELSESDAQLRLPELSPEQRQELQSTRAEKMTAGMSRLHSERARAHEREASLRQRLQRTRQARAQLLARAAELGITLESRN